MNSETRSEPHTIEPKWTVTEAVAPPGMIELHIGTPARTYAVVYADKANKLEVAVARDTAKLIAQAPETAKRLETASAALLEMRAALEKAHAALTQYEGMSTELQSRFDDATKELSPYETWMVKSNLEHAQSNGLEMKSVIAQLRKTGYDKIADAVAKVVLLGV
jgi:chromosome segregation ATPase